MRTMTRYPQPMDKSVDISHREYPQTYSHHVNNTVENICGKPMENIYGKPVDNLFKTQAGPVGLSGGLIQIQPITTSQISNRSMFPSDGRGFSDCITEAAP
jgi:hypothetical protein